MTSCCSRWDFIDNVAKVMLTVKKSKAAIPRRRFGKFLERKGKNTKESKKENKKWGKRSEATIKGGKIIKEIKKEGRE